MTYRTFDLVRLTVAPTGRYGTRPPGTDERAWIVPPRACRLGRLNDAIAPPASAASIAGLGPGLYRPAGIHR